MKRKRMTLAYCVMWGGAICSSLLLPSVCPAHEGPGTTSAGYLAIPIGPKTIGMGEVQSPLIGDPFGWSSNPGSLHALTGNGVGIFHAEWILDTQYNSLSGYHRFNNRLIVSGGFTHTYRPEIQGYDINGMPTEKLKNSSYQASVGIGYSPTTALTAGANIKYFRETLHTWAAGGMAVDLGLVYSIFNPQISVGFVAQNIGPAVKYDAFDEPIPITVRFGASHTVSMKEGNAKLLYAFDLAKPRYEEIYASIGSELEVYKLVSVRVGYCGEKYRAGSGFTMGAGVRIRQNFTLDYAWTPYGDLGTFHRFSLFYRVF